MIFITLGIAALLVLIDQISKLYILKNFEIGEIKELITIGSQKIFSITHVRNSGAAWSIMEGKTIFLIGLPVLIIGFVMFLLLSGKVKSKFEYVAYALVIAGGVGNLIDRIRFNEVVDFIKWEVFEFPVFNVADICIVVGAFMACFYYIFFDKDEKKTNAPATEAAAVIEAIEVVEIAEVIEQDNDISKDAEV